MNYTTKIKDANGVERDFKPFSYDITAKDGNHDVRFSVFTPGSQFYVDYKGAVRAAKIIGILFSSDYEWGRAYTGEQIKVAKKAYLYEIAGLGQELISGGIAGYSSVEDYKAKKKVAQSNQINVNVFIDRIKKDLKGKYEVKSEHTEGSYSGPRDIIKFYQWTWDGAKAVSHQVHPFNLFFDGTTFSLVPKELIDGAFPSKELCEQANEIRVIEF